MLKNPLNNPLRKFLILLFYDLTFKNGFWIGSIGEIFEKHKTLRINKAYPVKCALYKADWIEKIVKFITCFIDKIILFLNSVSPII